MATKIKWEEADFKWEKAPASGTPYLWNEVLLIEEIISENTSGIEKAVEELEPEKKKRLVHLVFLLKFHFSHIKKKRNKNLR